MAKVFEAIWTAPLLLIALTLFVVDVLVLFAFFFWIVGMFLQKRRNKYSVSKQVVKQDKSLQFNWKTSVKNDQEHEFEVPIIVADEEAGTGEDNKLTTLSVPSNTSINALSDKDLDTSLYSSQEKQSVEGINNDPTLTVSLYHYRESQQLVVSLISGKDIKQFNDEEDNQVSVSVILAESNHVQHSYVNKAPSPTFQEDFYFTTSKDLADVRLKFNVWILDRFSKKIPFGDVMFRIGDIIEDVGVLAHHGSGDLEQKITRRTHLTNESPKGELLVSLCYLPSADRLNITVVKARNLRPFEDLEKEIVVKISAVANGKIVRNKKIKPVKKSHNPVFNESITFNFPPNGELSVKNIIVVISLYVTRVLAPRRLLGRVIFGTSSEATSEAKDHWNQVLDLQRRVIARWQNIQ